MQSKGSGARFTKDVRREGFLMHRRSGEAHQSRERDGPVPADVRRGLRKVQLETAAGLALLRASW